MTPTLLMSGSTAKYCQTLAFGVPLADLLADDRIREAELVELLARDVADDAHREPRSRERLPMHDLIG